VSQAYSLQNQQNAAVKQGIGKHEAKGIFEDCDRFEERGHLSHRANVRAAW
jgi:hypothetical protein